MADVVNAPRDDGESMPNMAITVCEKEKNNSKFKENDLVDMGG